MIHLDFETRSKADLKIVGSYNYARDPSTEVICLAYSRDDEPVKLSHPSYPGIPAHNWPPKDLLDAIRKGELICAHNSSFEHYITTYTCSEKYGWPVVKAENWRCTMASASFYALPRSLEDVAKALGLDERKDAQGKRVMLKCSKPKADGSWHEDPEDLRTTFKYCMQDVEVERAIERHLGLLPEYEQRIWAHDMVINQRGVLFDRKLTDLALKIADDAKAKANIDIYNLTDGAVPNTNARKTFTDWAMTKNCNLTKTSLAAGEIPGLLANENIPQEVRKAIAIKSSVAASSVAKYKAIKNLMSPFDDKIRDNVRYAAAQTLRFGGRGVQLQNLPRGYSKEMDEVANSVLGGNLQWAEFLTSDAPMQILKKMTRGTLMAEQGQEFLISDYASIEVRVLFWLADETEGLEDIRKNDIYLSMAESVYSRPLTKKDKAERNLGKAIVLGAGYGLGFVKFLTMLESQGIILSDSLVITLLGDRLDEYKKLVTLEAPRIRDAGISIKDKLLALCGTKFLIDAYRAKFPKVKAIWKQAEDAARNAIKNPGAQFSIGKIYYVYDEETKFLQCYLPSGRPINYFKPELVPSYTLIFTAVNAKGVNVKIKLQLDSVNGNERESVERKIAGKGFTLGESEPEVWVTEKITYLKSQNTGFRRIGTYSGALAENFTQAVARDLLAEALLRLETRGFNPILHIHDEVVCQLPKGKRKVHEMEECMAELPEWAAGMPVAVEGFASERFRK